MKLILSTNGEIVRYGWTRGDGRFKIPNVPVGSHLLEIAAIGLLYPEVRDSVYAPCTLSWGEMHLPQRQLHADVLSLYMASA